jgi:hypothetical protein
MEKKCNKCNVVKDVSEFSKRKGNKDSLNGSCKQCVKEKRKEYYNTNKEKIKKQAKQYQEANKEKIKEYGKEYYNANNERYKELRVKNKDKRKQYLEANKEKLREKKRQYDQANKKKAKEYYQTNKDRIRVVSKKYREANKEKISEYSKEYREDNKEKIKEYGKEYREGNKDKTKNRINSYIKSRRKNDSLYKLKLSVKSSIKRHLKGIKSKGTIDIVGLDYKEFQDYLMVGYKDNMHLDHIIPISWAINEDEIYTLNHYSNFQILTAEDNMAKSNKYCKSENLKKVLNNHNDLTKLKKIIERNSDKIT